MKVILFFTLLFLVVFSHCSTAGDWNLAKDKNGIMVYTREAQGSPVKEFKAITTLDGTVDQIVAAILDYSNYHRWYDHCKSSYLINEQEDKSRIYQIELAMPFPFSDRDVVCKMVVVQNGEWLEVKITKEENALAEKEGVVRMPEAEGNWRLKQIAPGKVEVHHQFKGDPAGNIPSGIINLFLVAGPVNTFTQLQEYLNVSKQ